MKEHTYEDILDRLPYEVRTKITTFNVRYASARDTKANYDNITKKNVMKYIIAEYFAYLDALRDLKMLDETSYLTLQSHIINPEEYNNREWKPREVKE